MPVPPLPLTLRPHPHSLPAVSCALEAEVRPGEDGGLVLRYLLRADTARLRIPPRAAPGPADGLWRHTCFEAFVAAPDDAGYREFNFSPSGQWAAYAFRAERERDAAAPPMPAPTLTVERAAGHLALEAHLPPAALPPAPTGGSLRMNLTAVVEDAEGALAYWALHHPAAAPDFHHRGGFVLELPARTNSES